MARPSVPVNWSWIAGSQLVDQNDAELKRGTIRWRTRLHLVNRFPDCRRRTFTEPRFPFPAQHDGHTWLISTLCQMPICNLHLQSFVVRHGEIVEAEIREVVIFHSPDAELLPYQGRLPFDVIGDLEGRCIGSTASKVPSQLFSPEGVVGVLEGNLKRIAEALGPAERRNFGLTRRSPRRVGRALSGRSTDGTSRLRPVDCRRMLGIDPAHRRRPAQFVRRAVERSAKCDAAWAESLRFRDREYRCTPPGVPKAPVKSPSPPADRSRNRLHRHPEQAAHITNVVGKAGDRSRARSRPQSCGCAARDRGEIVPASVTSNVCSTLW